MINNYPAVFMMNNEKGYTVDFPDFDCLATEGDTLDHAIAMATDALALRVFFADIDGYELPEPSNIKTIDIQAVKDEYGTPDCEAFINIISVNADEYAKKHFIKYVKKSVTIPDWLIERAKDKKINVSYVLQKALAAELGVPLK